MDKGLNSAVRHLELLKLHDTDALQQSELANAPIFTDSVRRHVGRTTDGDAFTQFGLLGGDMAGLEAIRDMDAVSAARGSPLPFVNWNIKAPSSIFICGSQGSGKSHTLSCLLENCLIPSDANALPQPLTGIVFHYDAFTSEAGGQPCEAACLSTDPDVQVRVLCAPTNVEKIKTLYEKLPNVEVQELRLSQSHLNTKRMFDLMAVSSVQGTGMPLYFHVVTRILRELRIKQQRTGGQFNYMAFKRAIEREELTQAQKAPLEQRLDTLESFMAKEDVGRTAEKTATSWTPKAGQLTIVDLSCPCVTAESACALFSICLGVFLEQKTDIGRIVALDEAHKYMTDSAESMALTEALLSTIRLQRHLGTRVVVATQEPTISPKLLDLCSVTVVHRFTSPDWLAALRQHLAAAATSLLPADDDGQGRGRAADAMAELFQRIVSLRPGEALLFCPSALIGVAGGLVRLHQNVMHIRVRKRITLDGGQSVMAG